MEYLAGNYDVVVVGAGHAGCEAALSAARLGCSTLLLTLNIDSIALMPCNPAVGGPAKGHLVREIDALGGQMGINIDKTHIQIRMLNTAKGPAVHALRAQADKALYSQEMIMTMENQENLDIKQAIVEKIIIENYQVKAVVTNTGATFNTKTIILTTGTYLRGRIVIGETFVQGGANGQHSAMNLTGSLTASGFEMKKFKTGTPARVDKRSIDFSKMIEQSGDKGPLSFSFMTKTFDRPHVSCWLTYTNEKTHQIVRDNLHRAPLFTGVIEGVGPRYCPSFEDKVVRFADKPSHQLFLEPEGLKTNEYYVQGMSSSLPEDVQIEFYRSIKGLENVKVMRPAHAVEYDYMVPTQLKPNLETKEVEGLFAAGQINGTSGYEEAAAQGLMAGINAVLKIKDKEPFILKRSEGYIGVLIDDLVTKGTNEPYRLLTSRAEYRLILRQDNADLRLTEYGREIGLVNDERWNSFINKKEDIEKEMEKMRSSSVSPKNEKLVALLEQKNSSPLKNTVSLYDLLKRPELSYDGINDLYEEPSEVSPQVAEQVEIQIKYQGYIQKQLDQVEKFNKMENRRLPEVIDYKEIKGLRLEARQKLDNIKPISIGQASRISGVSPADISVLLVYLEQTRRQRLREEN